MMRDKRFHPAYSDAMESLSLNRASVAIAVITALGVGIASGSFWLALAALLSWVGSLWLACPKPVFEAHQRGASDWSDDAISTFIDKLELPLILVKRGRVTAANPAAELILGDHIMLQDARVALRHPDAVALLNLAGDARTVVAGLNGPRGVWSVAKLAVNDELTLIVLEDRTAQQDIARAHTDFVANASHELRTPLASILGYIETLHQVTDAPTRERFLGTMEREAKRMQSLVEDLMSLSRIEAEKHEVPSTPVDLAAIIRTIAHEDSNARLKIGLPASGTIGVRGDAAQLDQLVRNLTDNALKYGDTDKPVTISLTPTSSKRVDLIVSDHGPGIAVEHLPHLTRRFYRTDPGRSRAAGGTGLGLAIVKHIVERHRGTLDISSAPGEGTTVTVSLPTA